jgi:hypothetical protein
LAVGTKVPAAVELYKVANTVLTSVQGYRYAVHSDCVYIVDLSNPESLSLIPNRWKAESDYRAGQVHRTGVV